VKIIFIERLTIMASMDKRDKAFRKAFDGSLSAENKTKTNLARKINVSRPTLNNWCEKPGNVSLAHFRILVRELHFEDEEILRIIKSG